MLKEDKERGLTWKSLTLTMKDISVKKFLGNSVCVCFHLDFII